MFPLLGLSVGAGVGVGVSPGSGVGLGDGEGAGDGLGLGSAVSGVLWSGNFLLKMFGGPVGWGCYSLHILK